MGGFFIFVGFAVAIAGMVGTIKGKIGILRIASRKHASLVIVGGFILFMAGGAMAGGGSAPTPSQPSPRVGSSQVGSSSSPSPVIVESPSPTPPPTPSPSPSPSFYSPPPSPSPQPAYSPAKSSTTSNTSYSGTTSCGTDYYRNSDGVCVHRPVSSDTAPPGATAQCRDGTYSFSQHRSGTCSGHGGVAQWL
jgi:uncharacterized protein DUF3761